MLETLKTMFLKKLLFHKEKEKKKRMLIMKLSNQISFSGSVFKLNCIINTRTDQGYQSPPGKAILKNFY